MMTSTLNMEDLHLLWEDWQLESSPGLTLFDDPWKKVDYESTGITKSEPQSSSDDLAMLLGEPSSDVSDPFGQPWMEDVGLADMLQGLVQDSTDVMAHMIADAEKDALPETTSWSVPERTEVKGHEILRSLIVHGVDKPMSSPPSPEAQVAPTIELTPVMSFESSDGDEPVSSISLEDMDGIMHSPLSVEDVESFLSGSEPSSPASSQASKETSSCSELEAMLRDNSTTLNGKTRTRSSPYSRSGGRKSKARESVDSDSLQVEFLSKKDKKKLQNKNAAIRYRMKKKAESEASRGEVDDLEDKNKELKDKVDQLSREIQYMKDLMTDVYKAKGIIK